MAAVLRNNSTPPSSNAIYINTSYSQSKQESKQYLQDIKKYLSPQIKMQHQLIKKETKRNLQNFHNLH